MSPENGLNALDELLEKLRSDTIPSSVESRMRGQLADFQELLQSRPARQMRSACVRPSRRRFVTLVGGSLAAAVLVGAPLFHTAGRDALAQVADAIRTKPWVRMTMTGPDGDKFEICFSSTNRVASLNTPELKEVFQLDARESMRVEKGKEFIEWRTMDEHTGQEVSRFESLLAALGKETIRLPDSSAKIISQTKKAVTENGRKSIEFRLKFDNPDRAPREYETTIHVDPDTNLPFDLIEETPAVGKPVVRKFVFDYPRQGPTDIYALGIARNTLLIDRRQPRDSRQLLTRSHQARQQPPESYSAFVLVSITGPDWKDAYEGYRVHREGQQVTVEQADPDQLLQFRVRVAQKQVELPRNGDLALWWKEKIKELPFRPVEVDSKLSMIVPHLAGYPVLGVPHPDDRIVNPPHATFDPPGTSPVRVETPRQNVRSNMYWISPAQGHLALRWEMQAGKSPKDWIQTVIIDRAEKSPSGRWYPVQLRRGVVEHSGDDLQNEPGHAPSGTQLYRYFIDFD